MQMNYGPPQGLGEQPHMNREQRRRMEKKNKKKLKF
jgi:hypothetical protein